MANARGLIRTLTIAVALMVTASTATAATRTWTDSTGKHRVEAEFVKLEDDKVTLRKADGGEVTLPLERLSAKDRDLAERLAAQADDARNDMPGDKRAVGDAAVKFFEGLQESTRDGLRELLTQAARTSYDAGQSPVRDLPAPDRGRIRASRVNIEGKTATAEVAVRLRGQYQRTTLHLRQESGRWLINAITAPGPGGETLTVDFEGEAAAASGGDTAVSGAIAIPEGNARELLAFIEAAMKTDLRGAASREDAEEQLRRVFSAVLQAAEMILEKDATLAQKKDAAGYKLKAIQGLTTLGVPGMAERLAGFPAELDKLGLAELKPLVQTFLLTLQLQNYHTLDRSQAKALVERAAAHLDSAELGAGEAKLAQAAADVAEMIDTKFAANVNAALGKLLSTSSDASIRGLAETMLGTARRLDLIGNPMELTGVMLDGTPFNLSQYQGKVVLVDFWATWCGPCMAEMPNIRRNFEQYHDKGFEVVAVSVDRDLTALRDYVRKEAPPWTILAEYHPQVPADQRMSDYYGITGIPTTILVGADGKVISLSCRGEQLGTQLRRLFGPAG